MTNFTSTIIGIVLGAIEGTLAVFVLMVLPAIVLGQGERVDVMMSRIAVQGGVIFLIGGCIVGGILGRGGDLARLRHAMLMTVAALVVVLIGAGIRRSIANQPARSADGCTINPVSMSYRGGIHVVVYERICSGTPRRTLNASVLAGDDFNVPTTPGNALVLDSTDIDPDNLSRIFTDRSDTADIALLYDSRERVLSQHVHAGRFTVEFRHSNSPGPAGDDGPR